MLPAHSRRCARYRKRSRAVERSRSTSAANIRWPLPQPPPRSACSAAWLQASMLVSVSVGVVSVSISGSSSSTTLPSPPAGENHCLRLCLRLPSNRSLCRARPLLIYQRRCCHRRHHHHRCSTAVASSAFASGCRPVRVCVELNLLRCHRSTNIASTARFIVVTPTSTSTCLHCRRRLRLHRCRWHGC